MLLYKTIDGLVVNRGERFTRLNGWSAEHWDSLLNRDDLPALLARLADEGRPLDAPSDQTSAWRPPKALAPIGRQEVWAAGVTYHRSRSARMEEVQAAEAGSGDFYDRVYHADRPELFMKTTPHRVVGPGGALRLRRDSTWMVPEPELTLAVTCTGRIVGYTIGNDLSCRDIEGQNPLYLPQAKTFDRCCALGPALLVQAEAPGPDTTIAMVVWRGGAAVFSDSIQLKEMKKTLDTLVDYLFRDNAFPAGVMLMTGTGIVPPNDFSLQAGDEVTIQIDGIGGLSNTIE